VDESCGLCVFYIEDHCRRFPPFLTVTSGRGKLLPLRVPADWWCGEYVPRNDPGLDEILTQTKEK
jgi:hypothetical protein